MASEPQRTPSSQGQGKWAEEVANWYFRLNGFLQIPGFVLHGDQPRRLISDADIVGVRFPFSREEIQGIKMTDDRWITGLPFPGQIMFVLGEIKTSVCGINGPWTDPERGGMEKIVGRLGFADEELTSTIARCMYDQLYWCNDDFLLQYVAIGERSNHDLSKRFPKLKQLTWDELASFLFERFNGFGNFKGSHRQWGIFGSAYSRAQTRGQIPNPAKAKEFVKTYIQEGIRGIRELRD